MFGVKSERAVASGGLRPSLLEIAELLNQSSSTYREVADAYQELREDGKALDKEVLPALKEKLLATHYVEVIEQELVTNHLKQVEEQLEILLSTNAKWHDEFKNKLTKNSNRYNKAQADANTPIRRRRGWLRRAQTWFARRWRTISMQELIQQRRWIVAEMIDRLPETEQTNLTQTTLKSLGDEKLYVEAKEGDLFGLIDHALDRLTNEERQHLIDEVLSNIRDKERWSAEVEKKQRSLYENYQTYKTIQLILSKLPNSMKESFAILARRAQTRVQHTGNDVNQFREEVAVWFDRSMSRASGVYKRNAKGIGILIGLFLAIATNVDAAFITDRLSNDENLRRVVTEQAISTAKASGLEQARNNTSEALEELALPIGWNPTNFSEQLGCEPDRVSGNMPSDWSQVPSSCLKEASISVANPVKMMTMFAVRYPIALLRILFGWLIAGIAISMGAPFWFDVLGKVMNVRNSGGKPPSTEDQSTAKAPLPATTVKQ